LTLFVHERLMRNSGEIAASQAERRAFDRVRLDCPARLVTAGSYRVAQLCDLSRGGARLSLSNPPIEGTTGLLQWEAHESFGTVVWASDIACGIAFDTAIPAEWVAGSEATAGHERPRAGVTKIEFGTKRRKPGAGIGDTPTRPVVAPGYWTIALSQRPGSLPLTPDQMSAAEEMFFFGSPLAHVVQFEAS
jgi:hypothetical protein